MSNNDERTLWDAVKPGPVRSSSRQQNGPLPTDAGAADRQRSRKQTIKKLRASGHWLVFLEAARSIPQPFTLNDVSIACWKAHPDLFGMKGYPYPDNHKVHYILYGTRGLIAKGIVLRVRQGIFRVADAAPASR